MSNTSGATAPYFTQINDSADIVTITASSYTLSFNDLGRLLIFNSASAQTLTVPLLGKGFSVNLLRIGAGAVTVSAGSGATVAGGSTLVLNQITPLTKYADTTYLLPTMGAEVTKMVSFTQDATSVSHTGTVTLPAGSWLHRIQVTTSVLWTPTGAATMKVGDTADDDGYFTGIDLKATDLLVGEVLDTSASANWGGKEGVYLVAATGRSGPTSSNFGRYYAAGSNITGIITVGTPANTAGRTFMSVHYSVGDTIPAVVA